MTAIRVLIADDEALVRSGLRAILGAEPDIEVVGEAADGAEALSACRAQHPDVLLMDVRMPGLDGIAATRRILDAVSPPPRIVVVTTFENDDYVYEALRSGAAGFLLKRAGAEQLVQAVRTVAAGDSLLFPAAVRDLAARQRNRPTGPAAALTEREGEVLRLMARGCSNAEIAAQLVLGAETIKTHVGSILAKLGARDRTQAVIAAYESGFVAPGWTS
ncbi:MAG TPA: response regulator transcription factor [Actinocrinis sp.]|jgi:DNA-binding NarL/FixJ family response regulator